MLPRIFNSSNSFNAIANPIYSNEIATKNDSVTSPDLDIIFSDGFAALLDFPESNHNDILPILSSTTENASLESSNQTTIIDFVPNEYNVNGGGKMLLCISNPLNLLHIYKEYNINMHENYANYLFISFGNLQAISPIEILTPTTLKCFIPKYNNTSNINSIDISLSILFIYNNNILVLCSSNIIFHYLDFNICSSNISMNSVNSEENKMNKIRFVEKLENIHSKSGINMSINTLNTESNAGMPPMHENYIANYNNLQKV
jgi:hypothetical protein